MEKQKKKTEKSLVPVLVHDIKGLLGFAPKIWWRRETFGTGC
jgi:hypothetical protein